MADDLNFKGEVRFELWDKDGNKKLDRIDDNLVVKVGRTHVVRRMLGATTVGFTQLTTRPPVMRWIALGTSTQVATYTNTGLVAASAGGGGKTYWKIPSITLIGDVTLQWIRQWAAASMSISANEAGLFNASPPGVMLSRIVFPSGHIRKTLSDTLRITWRITVSG